MSGKSSEGLKSAADVAKQVIALATGVIAVTVTFFDKLEGDTPSLFVRLAIFSSWLFFIGSIGCALGVLLGVTTALDIVDRVDNGELAPPKSLLPPGAPPPPPPADPDEPPFDVLPHVWQPRVQEPAIAMVVCFGLALALTAVAAFSASTFHPAPAPVSSAAPAAASALGPQGAGPTTVGGGT